MRDDADPVLALARALARWPAGKLLVALSGGLDSVALFHALASQPEARSRGLRAIHVDHGLHAHSEAWAQVCTAFAATLSVPIRSVRVEVRNSGEGLEAAARKARYAAIEAAMADAELVVAAHHADDQAETLLLRLVRGAGPRGLAAMRPLRPLGRGWLARPWLEVPRSAIAAYAARHALPAIDDPANADPRFDRTHLRAQVLPALSARWPQAPSALARSAVLLRDLSEWLATTVASELARCRGVDPATLHLRPLAGLPRAARAEVLRAWYLDLALDPPDQHALDQFETTMLDARDDAQPLVAWPGAELRRWRGMLYASAPSTRPQPAWSVAWDGRAAQALPNGAGTLALDAPQPLPLRIASRRGGERIRPDPARPSRELKHVLAELGIPPWRRRSAPLLWHADELWAAGDWIAAHALRDYERTHSVRLRWLR